MSLGVTGSRLDAEAHGPPRPGPVLISYESSPRGRMALFHALDLARRTGRSLTVVSVAAKESPSGCARCRQNAVMWNQEMRFFAGDDLAEAADLVEAKSHVDYGIAVGEPVPALAEFATRRGAEVVVVPWEPSGRFRRLLSPRVADKLRDAGPWEVIVAPPPLGPMPHAPGRA